MFFTEGLLAVRTGVGFFTRMNSAMQLQVIFTREHLAAYITNKDVLSRVHLVVQPERVPVGEHAAAGVALVHLAGRRRVGMTGLLVRDHVAVAGEGLAALVTLERLLARVHVLVLQQPFVHVESLPARVAAVLVLLRVALLVLVQRPAVDGRVVAQGAPQANRVGVVLAFVDGQLVLPLIRLAAAATLEGPRFTVHDGVLFEGARVKEGLAARFAREAVGAGGRGGGGGGGRRRGRLRLVLAQFHLGEERGLLDNPPAAAPGRAFGAAGAAAAAGQPDVRAHEKGQIAYVRFNVFGGPPRKQRMPSHKTS